MPIFLLVTHLFLFRFKLSRSFYPLPILLPDISLQRSSSTFLLIAFFFSSRSPIISLSASCPSSFWYARLSAAYTLISPLTQSLCSCSFLLSAAVDLSLLPACRPSSLRLSPSFSFFLRVKFDPPPTRGTRSSSQSVAGRPDCPQEVRHHRRRRRNRARAVRQVYGGDTKRKKRTHSNGYSRSITIPIRWARNEQPMTPLTDLSRLRSPPRFPSSPLSSRRPLALRRNLSRFTRSLLHSSTCPASLPPLRSPSSHLAPRPALAQSRGSILGDRGEGSTSYVLR